jgi:Leucine-rich repeat (LRR) protein
MEFDFAVGSFRNPFHTSRLVIQLFNDSLMVLELALLDLQNNMLGELPVEITQLKSLAHLDLRNNNLLQLPAQMGFMPKLSKLLLEGSFYEFEASNQCNRQCAEIDAQILV